MYMPHATSLRMGRLGYQSDAQASLAVSYNSLDGYGASLQDALTRPYPAYEAIGIRNPGGDYNQLATSLLQIENEFYGTIRPKRVIYPGERPLHALRERGVEYVEVRLMDLDPFVPVGIAAPTMRFLDVFLLHCLLADSPPDTPRGDRRARRATSSATAARGREPGPAAGARRTRGRADRMGRRDAGAVRSRSPPRSTPRMAAALHADAVRAAEAALADAGQPAFGARARSDGERRTATPSSASCGAQSEQTRAELLALPFSADAAGRVRTHDAELDRCAEADRGGRHACPSRSTASSTSRPRGWASRTTGRRRRRLP